MGKLKRFMENLTGIYYNSLMFSNIDSEIKIKIILDIFKHDTNLIRSFIFSFFKDFLNFDIDPQIKKKIILGILKIDTSIDIRRDFLLDFIDIFLKSNIDTTSKKKILQKVTKDFSSIIKKFFLEKVFNSENNNLFLDKLFLYFKQEGGNYKDIENFFGPDEDYLFIYKLLETQNNAKELGLEVYSYGYNKNGSAYLEFSQENKIINFIIRVSNHDLQKGNYLPAGVINSFAETEFPLTKEKIFNYYEQYKSYSLQVQKYLWENRYIYGSLSDFDWIADAVSEDK